ncbi:MAG: hypothetical protein KY468_07265 [Armatimonadetes bacterium]|nr:hypothetical protein [Armatimonadota bacterium]
MNPEDILYSRVPGRVDLAGFGTDLSPYREEHGGQVVSAALRIYSHAMLRPRKDPHVVLRRLNDGVEFSWLQPRHLPLEGPLIPFQAIVNRLDLDRGFDLWVGTDLPLTGGLAAEASMGIAVLSLLEEFAGRLVEAEELAQLYYTVQRHDLGLSVAHHEPYACAFGGFSEIEVDGKKATKRNFLVKESVRLSFEENAVLVSINDSPSANPAFPELQAICAESGSRGTAIQHQLKAVTQSVRDTLAAGDLRSFPTFLDENWQIYTELYPSLPDARVRHLIEVGHGAGARGGTVCGISGDCLFFLCDDLEIRHRVAKALTDEGCTLLPFQLDELGVRVWRQPQLNS